MKWWDERRHEITWRFVSEYSDPVYLSLHHTLSFSPSFSPSLLILYDLKLGHGGLESSPCGNIRTSHIQHRQSAKVIIRDHCTHLRIIILFHVSSHLIISCLLSSLHFMSELISILYVYSHLFIVCLLSSLPCMSTLISSFHVYSHHFIFQLLNCITALSFISAQHISFIILLFFHVLFE